LLDENQEGNNKKIKVLCNATCNGELLNENQEGNNKKIFNGIFVYKTTSEWFEFDGEKLKDVNKRLKEALQKSRGIVNHICIGNNIFIKFWYPGEGGGKKNVYTIYYIKKKEYKDLAFAYFISNLIKSTSERDLKRMSWFLFPTSKEIYPSIDIPIDNNTESYNCEKDCKKQKKKKK
jgi:hypothetical protein